MITEFVHFVSAVFDDERLTLTKIIIQLRLQKYKRLVFVYSTAIKTINTTLFGSRIGGRTNIYSTDTETHVHVHTDMKCASP